MNTHADFASPDSTESPQSIRQRLRMAALQRNLRTAAVLGIAVSGGLISATWLAATAGGTFLALGTWRYKQLRHPAEAGHNRSKASSL